MQLLLLRIDAVLAAAERVLLCSVKARPIEATPRAESLYNLSLLTLVAARVVLVLMR